MCCRFAGKLRALPFSWSNVVTILDRVVFKPNELLELYSRHTKWFQNCMFDSASTIIVIKTIPFLRRRCLMASWRALQWAVLIIWYWPTASRSQGVYSRKCFWVLPHFLAWWMCRSQVCISELLGCVFDELWGRETCTGHLGSVDWAASISTPLISKQQTLMTQGNVPTNITTGIWVIGNLVKVIALAKEKCSTILKVFFLHYLIISLKS